MKKITILSIVIAFLMQACSTNKMFSHKRYSHLKWIKHGYDINTNENNKEETIADPQIKNAEAVELKNEEIITNTEIVIAEGENQTQNSPINSSPLENNIKSSNSNQDQSQVEELPISTEQTIPVAKKHTEILKPYLKPNMDEDVKLIVCVILCLIIPPLGMYLWDNNTDSWFIIDLVLFLCIGLFYFGAFGFLWLTSIVIAFLRVFGLI